MAGSKCVFPGSFDPVTCGHLNLIRRVSAVFDHVSVVLMVNIKKKGLIPPDERFRILEKACSELMNVKVEMWEGLLSEYVRKHPGSIVVRGVRSVSEFESERNAASINRKLNPEMETFLVPSDNALECISSSAVKEIATFGGDFRGMIPENIYDDVAKWLIRTNEEESRWLMK